MVSTEAARPPRHRGRTPRPPRPRRPEVEAVPGHDRPSLAGTPVMCCLLQRWHRHSCLWDERVSGGTFLSLPNPLMFLVETWRPKTTYKNVCATNAETKDGR